MTVELYRYGFSCGNVYGLDHCNSLYVRELSSGNWIKSDNKNVLRDMNFGKNILPDSAAAEKIFIAYQAAIRRA